MILYAATYHKINRIGGKAKGLYMLRNAGITVPDFFVITTDTFDEVIRMNDGKNTGAALRKFELNSADKSIINTILKKWNFPEVSLVVRSSVADEDGSKHSFAGVMDSYLHVNSLEMLYEKIAEVAASAYSTRATVYRREKKIDQAAVPAVIVQLQVNATVSGIIFSTWPQYPQEMAIHAVNGFGDGLTGGTIQPEEYYLLKKDGKLNRQISTDEKAEQQLRPEQLVLLYQTATRLELSTGKPQDIEFVFSTHTLYIVQSRPITEAIPEVIVYDNSNIQESYCGVTTPLTFSFAQKAYATVYTQTMQALNLPAEEIAAQQTVVNNLLGLVKGRIYYNINNWYKGLQLLPSFRQNKADMERMMGVEEPIDFVEDKSLSFFQKIKMLPRLAGNLVRLLTAFGKLKSTVPAFLLNFQKHYRGFYSGNAILFKEDNNITENKVPAESIGQQLADLLSYLDKNLLQQWSTPIVNDFYVMMNNGRAQRLLQRAGISSPEAFLSHYLSGNQHIASAQPAIAMQALAVKAVKLPQLHQLILLLPVDIHDQVQVQFPDFWAAVNQYIELYGDRTIGELKLETITMRESPFVLYKYLKNIVATVQKDHVEKTGMLHTEAAAKLESLLNRKNIFFKKRVLRCLQQLQNGIQYREAMRLERTRLFGMYRRIFLAAGQWLLLKNLVEHERDIFYLGQNEITPLLNGKPAGSDLKNIIAKRKNEFASYRLIQLPSRIEVPAPPILLTAQDKKQENILQGTGCVPGIIIGEVIVVDSTADNLEVYGKIIVAARTDPGWAVLFPACKAVLISKGSSLSHSVILLREFGIPTIINIPGLMTRIKTGMQLTIDGSTGEINITAHGED